jgi:hypothetical protein
VIVRARQTDIAAVVGLDSTATNGGKAHSVDRPFGTALDHDNGARRAAWPADQAL